MVLDRLIYPRRKHIASIEDNNVTANEDNDVGLSPEADNLARHGFRSKTSMSLTLNKCNNRCLATSRSDKRAGEEHSGSTEVKLSSLKYRNQEPMMIFTGNSAYFARI